MEHCDVTTGYCDGRLGSVKAHWKTRMTQWEKWRTKRHCYVSIRDYNGTTWTRDGKGTLGWHRRTLQLSKWCKMALCCHTRHCDIRKGQHDCTIAHCADKVKFFVGTKVHYDTQGTLVKQKGAVIVLQGTIMPQLRVYWKTEHGGGATGQCHAIIENCDGRIKLSHSKKETVMTQYGVAPLDLVMEKQGTLIAQMGTTWNCDGTMGH